MQLRNKQQTEEIISKPCRHSFHRFLDHLVNLEVPVYKQNVCQQHTAIKSINNNRKERQQLNVISACQAAEEANKIIYLLSIIQCHQQNTCMTCLICWGWLLTSEKFNELPAVKIFRPLTKLQSNVTRNHRTPTLGPAWPSSPLIPSGPLWQGKIIHYEYPGKNECNAAHFIL